MILYTRNKPKPLELRVVEDALIEILTIKRKSDNYEIVTRVLEELTMEEIEDDEELAQEKLESWKERARKHNRTKWQVIKEVFRKKDSK